MLLFLIMVSILYTLNWIHVNNYPLNYWLEKIASVDLIKDRKVSKPARSFSFPLSFFMLGHHYGLNMHYFNFLQSAIKQINDFYNLTTHTHNLYLALKMFSTLYALNWIHDNNYPENYWLKKIASLDLNKRCISLQTC